MKNIKRIHHFHEGHPHDRMVKVFSSFLMITALTISSFSATQISRLKKYARFMAASAQEQIIHLR